MTLDDLKKEKPLHSRLMAAIYAVSNKSINGGREGKAAKELAADVEKGKFTEQDVFDCLEWAKIEKFNTFAPSLLSIQKLMSQYLLMNKAAEIVEGSPEILDSFKRVKTICDMLNQQADDHGFNRKTAQKTKQIAEGLLKHFDRAKIPTNRIFDVYYHACAIKEENSYWSPTVYLKAWDDLQRKDQVSSGQQKNEVCAVCKDTLNLTVANPETGETKTVRCPNH